MASDSTLSYLFPTPGLAPSALSPTRLPGASPESSIALRTILKDNHLKWHIFNNELRYHNHAAHHAISLWALGADASVIHAGYNKDINQQIPAFKSPGAITLQNFNDHLGDDKYFNAYMEFFTGYVQEKGVSATLEDFIFSPKANLGTNAQLAVDEQPQMLNRFLAGVLHPMIHTAYGTEFNLPGMIVEGLAQAAVNLVSADLISPLKLFEADQVVNEKTEENIHALSVLARIMHDSQLVPPSTPKNEMKTYNITIEKYSIGIAEHVRAWTINVSKLSEGDEELNRKLEEVAWAVCIMYGIGGWTVREGGNHGGHFNADMFFMHFVTSSMFLPSLCTFLSSSSKVRLLRAYFATVCMWYLTRGGPAFDIAGFFSQEISLPSGLDPDPRKGGVPNLWIPLLQSAMAHPDTHLIKTQTALCSWAQKFGAKGARVPNKGDLDNRLLDLDASNTKAFNEGDVVPPSAATLNGSDTMPITKLPGSEHLDGTLFLRTALLTAGRLGWVREGQDSERSWDFAGFFKETTG